MSNVLIYSDWHIKDKELTECEVVGNEIIGLCNQHNVNEVYNLGDSFDQLEPSSLCLDLFANFIKNLNRPIKIISANSHESTSKIDSILNHYGILSNQVTIAKEFDDGYSYFGHFTLNESKINYGATRSKTEFLKYKYTFLGHCHLFQLIHPNICHLGSARFIDFAESQETCKKVCLIEDYRGPKERVSFIGLKSPYPMETIELMTKTDQLISTRLAKLTEKGKIDVPGASVAKNQGELRAYLDSLPKTTKVRVIFKDFKSYTQVINMLDTYRNKFVLFREKKDFLIQDTISVDKKPEISLKESLTEFLNKNKVDDNIKQILLGEIK